MGGPMEGPMVGPVVGPVIPVVENNPVVVAPVASEQLTASTGNDSISGGTGNTNFTMVQGTTLGGTDTVTDLGGTDTMTFSNLSNVNFEVAISAGATTTATIKTGTTFQAGTQLGQVSFTDVEYLVMQDSVGLTADQMTLALSMTGTGIAIAVSYTHLTLKTICSV